METMRMTDPIKRMIVEAANIQDVKKKALEEGMLTLRRCGLMNAMRGKTSVEEVERITMQD
jgi:type IV pilus assembly protein PilB